MAYIVLPLPPRRLTLAYQHLFSGTGSAEDAELVRADLEAFSGYFQVTAPETPDGETKFSEGQRSVYGRIHTIRQLTDAAYVAAERAASDMEEPL